MFFQLKFKSAKMFSNQTEKNSISYSFSFSLPFRHRLRLQDVKRVRSVVLDADQKLFVASLKQGTIKKSFYDGVMK